MSLYSCFLVWSRPSASDISLVPSLAQSSLYTRTIHPKKINLSTSDACCTSVTSSPGTLVHLQRRLQLASSVWRKWTVVRELKSNLKRGDQREPQLTGNASETTIIHAQSAFQCDSVCSENMCVHDLSIWKTTLFSTFLMLICSAVQVIIKGHVSAIFNHNNNISVIVYSLFPLVVTEFLSEIQFNI